MDKHAAVTEPGGGGGGKEKSESEIRKVRLICVGNQEIKKLQ